MKQQYGDWVAHKGDKMPVDGKTKVQIFLMEHLGQEADDWCGPAKDLEWEWCGQSWDIIAYRVLLEPKKEVVEMTGVRSGQCWAFTFPNMEGDTHKIIFEVVDGKVDCSSVKMMEI